MFTNFSGSSRRPRNVNLSGQRDGLGASRAWRPPSGSAVAESVSAAQAERQQRQHERRRLKAVKDVQRVWRGHRARRELCSARREAFDELYRQRGGHEDIPSRLRAALPLLLFFCSRRVPEDRSRLLLFCEDAESQGFESLCHHRSQPVPLTCILVDQLDAAVAESDAPEIRDGLLRFLNHIVASAPRALTSCLDRYYKIIACLCRGRTPSSSLVAEAIISPLLASPAHGAPDCSYQALALSFLTESDLTLFEKSAKHFAKRMDNERLALAITQSSVGKLSKPNDDAQLYLLAHFIELTMPQGALTTHPSVLEALYLQLSSMVSMIKLRFPRKNSDEPRKERSESSEQLRRPLPPYVRDKLSSIVDSAGIANLFQAFSNFDREGRTHSFLSSYILVLYRCFPDMGDDICMRLYLQDVQLDGYEVPYVCLLWRLVSKTSIFASIIGESKSPVKYLRQYLAKSEDSPHSSAQHEWDLIFLFLQLYVFILRLCDDEDFFGGMNQSPAFDRPYSRLQSCGLGKGDVERLSLFLKSVCFSMYYHAQAITAIDDSGSTSSKKSEHNTGGTTDSPEAINLEGMRHMMSTALRMLYERDSRRQFLPSGHWLLPSFTMDAFIKDVVAEEQREYDEDSGDDYSDSDSASELEELLNPVSDSFFDGPRRIRWSRRGREQTKRQKESRMAVVGPSKEILRNMPFGIPFETRVRIFRQFIQLDKIRRRNGATSADEWRMRQMMLVGGHAHSPLGRHRATIKRGQLFQDAFQQFWDLGEGLKEPIEITFIDQFDSAEAGIDGGGVTKEFLTSTTTEVFKQTETTAEGPSLFASNQQGLLYPNPTALDEMEMIMDEAGISRGTQHWREVFAEYLRRFEFMGRIVGKCMYEGLLIDFSFASFFLLKWALGHKGENSYKGSINDVRELDEEMYQGLLYVKNYPRDVEDMALDFTINDRASDASGRVSTQTRHLIPRGSSVAVTNENRLLYISYVARHRLVAQAEMQTTAFLRGLRTVIHPTWLCMFNQTELQRLVGGDSRSIDVADLRANTEYGGLYVIGDDGEEHPTIKMFWEVMGELAEADQRNVLKYVTSTPRAPLLGFSQLNPRFTIRDSGGPDRLPSASTCVNMLKLPQYADKETLTGKLLLAVSSGAGFDMS